MLPWIKSDELGGQTQPLRAHLKLNWFCTTVSQCWVFQVFKTTLNWCDLCLKAVLPSDQNRTEIFSLTAFHQLPLPMDFSSNQYSLFFLSIPYNRNKYTLLLSSWIIARASTALMFVSLFTAHIELHTVLFSWQACMRYAELENMGEGKLLTMVL